MGRWCKFWLCAVTVATALLVRVGAAPAPVRPGEGGLYGLPARMRSLTDFDYILFNNPLTSLQTLEVVLQWFEGERREPSAPSLGLGGGIIDSGYIQGQLVIALANAGPPGSLDWLLSSGKVADEVTQDVLRLALAACGDGRQIEPLIRILRVHDNPDFRWLAAERLGLLGASEAIPALEAALQDPFSAKVYATAAHGDTLYPVRDAAQSALRRLRDTQAVAAARTRRAKFAARLPQARKSLAKNAAALRRLVLAANGQYASRKVARAPAKARSGKYAK